ncbi:MAG TPA: autotransporter-associated beta strand repeat-containing protein, partial [Candidatus Anammoximicrobium sp.]|nr:autotransporter-associated beta strand repeat-containing protein [Candidatus Anammoximicrobium sp.]
MEDSGGGGASTIIFTGLEPVDMTGSTVTDLVLNLPAGADHARLSEVGGKLRLESTDAPATLELFDYDKPAGLLQINGGVDDTLTISTALSLNGNLDVTAGNIYLDGGTLTTAGAGRVLLDGTVWLGTSTSIDTSAAGGGNITFTSHVAAMNATDGDLTLNAGGGDILVDGMLAGAYYSDTVGPIVGEAELFQRRTAAGGWQWLVVPDEAAGTAPAIANARGGRFLQNLPDANGGPGGQSDGPTVEYDLTVAIPGTYRLWVRWDGNKNGPAGNSDSFYARIVELVDGVGSGQADWYVLGREVDSNFATESWHSAGGIESTGAGGSSPVQWNFPAAGTYTLQFDQREDGVAIDAFVLQSAADPAPTGNGPAAQPIGRLEIVQADQATFNSSLSVQDFFVREAASAQINGDLTVSDSVRIGYAGRSATVSVSGGTVRVGNGETGDDFIVGTNPGNMGSASLSIGTLNLSAASGFTADVNRFHLGVKGDNLDGVARGIVTLAANNTVTANEIKVGRSGNNGGASELHLGGGTNAIATPLFVVGEYKATGTVDVPADGVVNLGTDTNRTEITVGSKNVSTGGNNSTVVDFSAGTATIYASNVNLGWETTTAGGGHPAGILSLGGGTLDVGGNVWEGSGSTGQGTSTVNLYGGTMTVGGVLQVNNLTMGSTGKAASVQFTNPGTSGAGNLYVRSNTATVSTVMLPAGHTLDVTGTLSVGVPSTTGASTSLTMTGGGDVSISNASGTIDIGIANSDQNATENQATVNLSGLNSFTAEVTNFRVGYGSRIRSTLTLSDTANSITADILSVSNSVNSNASPSLLRLGTGTNTLHANTIEAGLGKGIGTITFASQAAGSPGTVAIRGRTGGTSAANITLASNPTSGTGATPTGTLNLLGHAADVVAGTLTMARRTVSGGGGVTATLSLDAGEFTVAAVDMGTKSNGSGPATATLNVGGGTFTVSAGGSFQLANHTGGGAALGTLNVTGGTVTANADIIDAGGTSTTTITLDGGTLDMAGHAIGGATPIDVLHFRGGTLQNVAEINGGATGLTKTTGGTLILDGTNAYTGASSVDGGTLLVDGDNSAATGAVTVAAGTTLGGTGVIGGAVTVPTGGTITGGTLGTIGSPEAGDIGTLTVASLSLSGGTFQADLVDDTADQIRSGGTIDLQDPVPGLLALNAAGATTPGTAFRLIDNTAAGPITDMFQNVAEGHVTAFNGTTGYYSYLAGTGNDFSLTTSGPAVYTEMEGGADFELRLLDTSPEDTLQLLRNGDVVDSRRYDLVTAYTVNGIGGQTDTLTVNYAASGGFFDIPVTFDGGAGGNDSLSIIGGSFIDVILNHTAAHSGTLDLDGTVITYAGLEPVLIGVGGLNLTVNLTAGDDTTQFSMLDADADTLVDDLSILSLTGTHESTTVLDIGGYSSLTIYGGAGDDRLLLAAFTPGVFSGDLAIDGGGQTDFVLLGTALSVASLEVTAAATVLNADITTSGGGDVTIDSAAWIGDSITIDTSAGGGGDVSFTGTVSGLSVSPDLSLNAGTDGTITFAGEIGAFGIPLPAPAAYFEVGGRIVAEAEDYTLRIAHGGGDNWLVVPAENPGAGGTFANARGGAYVQDLPDGGAGGGGPTNPPEIRHLMYIATPGTYRLYFRWDGFDGGSDSIFTDIVELKDGAGGTIADWYEFTIGADKNFATTPWDSAAGFELNSADASPKTLPLWSIPTPGFYTFRVTAREDGAAVDSFVLQRSSLAAPTGTGPATTYTGVALDDLTIVNANQAAFLGPVAARSFTQQAVVGLTTFQEAVTVDEFSVRQGAVQLLDDVNVTSGGVIGSNGQTATVTAIGGDVSLGSGSGTFRIGERNANLNTGTSGTLDVSAAASFHADLANFYLGWLTNNSGTGNVTGTLRLGADNNLDAGLLRLGHIDGGNVRTVTGNIQLGAMNVFHVDTLIVGSHKGTGNVSFASAGVLDLSGRSGARADLRIGDNSDSGTSATATGTMNLSGGTFVADLDRLVIGDYASDAPGTGSGSAVGTLTLSGNGDNAVQANSVLLANYDHTAATGSGTKQASGTIAMSGGSFVVNGNLVRGVNNGAGNGAVTTSTVNVNGGAMIVHGDFAVHHVRVGHNGGTGSLTVDTGTVQIGAGSGSNFNVALRDNGGTSGLTTGDVDFSAASAVAIDVGNVNVATSNGAATEGHLALSDTANTITAGTVTVSDNSNSGQPDNQSTLTLGSGPNTITTNTLYVGRRKGNGLVAFSGPGGTLDLGSAAQRTDLYIGMNDVGTSSVSRGEWNLTGGAGGTLYLNDLSVGWGNTGGGSGGALGYFTGGAGTIDIGPQESDVARVQVGYNDGGRNTADGGVTGAIDLAATGTLVAAVDQLLIGTALNSASAKGSVALAQDNTLYADLIRIAHSTNTYHTTPELTSTLTLGESSDLFVDTFRLGEQRSNAGVDVRGPGSRVTLAGNHNPAADLVVGRNNAATNAFVTGTFDLSNAATFDATLDRFHIGVKGDTADGRVRGLVTLATDNTISANELLVGQSGNTGATAADEQSQLHLGGGTNDLTVAVMVVGDRKTTGLVDFATPGGVLYLGTPSNPVGLVLGRKSVDTGANAAGVMDLRTGTAQIHASQISLGQETNTSGTGTPSGTLVLGHGALTVTGNVNENHASGGAGVSSLTVLGNQTFTVGGTVAPDTFFIGLDGVAGSVTFTGVTAAIGEPGNVTDLLVGRRESDTSTTFQGTLDLSAVATFQGRLDEFSLGTSNPAGVGSAQGQPRGLVTLAGENTIDARLIQIGDSRNVGLGGFNNRLLLGTTNAITVDTMVVGGDKSTGTIGGSLTFASGSGTLDLAGSSGPRTDLYVGHQEVGTGGGARGVMDLAGGTFNAALDEWVIGSKPNSASGATEGVVNLGAGTVNANSLLLGRRTDAGTAGTVQGTLTIGNASVQVNNDLGVGLGGLGEVTLNGGSLAASSIILGVAAGNSTGTVNLNGGTLQLGTLQTNGGMANFNWSAGKIQNLPGQDLSDTNVRIDLLTATDHEFQVDTGQTATIQSGASLADVGALRKTGDGTLVLIGSSTYAGDTVVHAGVLQTAAAEVIPHGSGHGDVYIDVDGTLELGPFTETINGLWGSGTVTSTPGDAYTLAVGDNNATSVFDGVITNSLSVPGYYEVLKKIGAGTFSLNGDNTYTGTTVVEEGALLVNGSTGPGSPVQVNQSSLLGGTGTINGTVELAAGST